MAKTTQKTPAPKARYDILVPDSYEAADGSTKINWIRVGVAFPHSDGQGYQIELKALPVGGKLVMKLHEPKTE
jgi:hypothetical protein